MRTVAEYMAKAVEFDALAARTDTPLPLRKRYTDMAECYRLLAQERERLVAQGVIPMDPLTALPPP
jgi:hypothetical protein